MHVSKMIGGVVLATCLALPAVQVQAADCDTTGNWRTTSKNVGLVVRAKAKDGQWTVDGAAVNGGNTPRLVQKLTDTYQDVISDTEKVTGTKKEPFENLIGVLFSNSIGTKVKCNFVLMSRNNSGNNYEVKAKGTDCEATVNYQCTRQFKSGTAVMQWELVLTNAANR